MNWTYTTWRTSILHQLWWQLSLSCQNINHHYQQQFFPRLLSLKCSDNAIMCYPWVQTIYWMGRLTLKFLRTVNLKNSFLLYLIIYTDLLLIWRWQATGWWWWCTLCCAQKSSRNTCCAFHLWNIKSSILMTQFTKHYIGNSVFSIASYRNLTRSGRHWVYNCTPNTWTDMTKSKGNFTKFFRGWNRGPKNFNLNNILRCAPRKNNKGSPFLLLGRLVPIKDRDLFKQKLNTTCSTTVNFLWYNKRLKKKSGRAVNCTRRRLWKAHYNHTSL